MEKPWEWSCEGAALSPGAEHRGVGQGSDRGPTAWQEPPVAGLSQTSIPPGDRTVQHSPSWPRGPAQTPVRVAQLCPTLCDPVDCSPPGSSVHGILQARILE